MALKLGDEFRAAGTPSQDLLRRLLYYASIDSGSVLTGGFKGPAGIGSERESAKRADVDSAWLQLSDRHQARIAVLQDRLDELDRVSLIALRDAEERLEEIKRNANHTIDGRLAFEAENGKIYDENGTELDPDEIDRSQWDPDAWKWRDWQDARHSMDAATDFRRDVLDARETLETDPHGEGVDSLDDRISQLETTAMEFRVAKPPQHRLPANPERTEPRSTSMAKLYQHDRATDDATARAPFFRAADPAPSATPEPATPAPAPNTPFSPD